MEFLCLNCFSTFEVSEDQLPEPGGLLTCPICGHKQPFAGIKVNRTSKDVTTGNTKKNKRISGEYHIISGPKEDTSPKPRDTTTAQFRKAAGLMVDDTEEAQEVTYKVVSPSGLTFEFQDMDMLIRWGEMVANPAPYLVYEGESKEADGLDAILSQKGTVVKHKNKAKESHDTIREPRESNTDDKTDGHKDAETDKNVPESARKRTGPLSTSEFKFRTEVQEEKKWPMFIVYLVLAALFGAVALFAVYEYILK